MHAVEPENSFRLVSRLRVHRPTRGSSRVNKSRLLDEVAVSVPPSRRENGDAVKENFFTIDVKKLELTTFFILFIHPFSLSPQVLQGSGPSATRVDSSLRGEQEIDTSRVRRSLSPRNKSSCSDHFLNATLFLSFFEIPGISPPRSVSLILRELEAIGLERFKVRGSTRRAPCLPLDPDGKISPRPEGGTCLSLETVARRTLHAPAGITRTPRTTAGPGSRSTGL